MFGRRWFGGYHGGGCSGYEAAAACGPVRYGAGAGTEEAKEYAELRALVVETVEAATQVARGNQPELVARATEVLKDTRKRLYELLAQRS